jgi:hypothetical protein
VAAQPAPPAGPDGAEDEGEELALAAAS